MPKYILVTFASAPFYAAMEHLVREATACEWFHAVECWTDKRLAEEEPAWVRAHDTLLAAFPTVGYGLWSWKPFILRKTAEKWAGEDTVLVYMDAGCELNASADSRPRFQEYVRLAEGSGACTFQLNRLDQQHCKGSALRRVRGDDWKRRTDQVIATIFVMALNHPNANAILDEWQALVDEDEGALLRDPPPGEHHDARFKRHRHDQALFSLLVHKHNGAILRDETFHAPHWHVGGHTFPFWARRRRS